MNRRIRLTGSSVDYPESVRWQHFLAPHTLLGNLFSVNIANYQYFPSGHGYFCCCLQRMFPFLQVRRNIAPAEIAHARRNCLRCHHRHMDSVILSGVSESAVRANAHVVPRRRPLADSLLHPVAGRRQ